MAWNIRLTATARRQLRKLDREWQGIILNYLDEVSALPDPRLRGKNLSGDRQGIWRYRIGDYRVLCSFEDNHLVILVLELGHRREIYR